MSGNAARRRPGTANTQRTTTYSTATSSSGADQQPLQPSSTMTISQTSRETANQSARSGSSQDPSGTLSRSTLSSRPRTPNTEIGYNDPDRQHRRARQPIYQHYALPDSAQMFAGEGAQFGGNIPPVQYSRNAFEDDLASAVPATGRHGPARQQTRNGLSNTNSYPAPQYSNAIPSQSQIQNRTVSGPPAYSGGNVPMNGIYSSSGPSLQQLQQQPSSMYGLSTNQQIHDLPATAATDPDIVNHYNAYQASLSRGAQRGSQGPG